MPRCNIVVFDQGKRKERKCLYKRKWGKTCSFHARKYIVKIQAAWRAYSTKNRVNLFKTLPEDVWKHILHFINLRNNTIKLLGSHLVVYTRRILFMQNNYMHMIYIGGWVDFNEKLNVSIYNRDYIRKILKTY